LRAPWNQITAPSTTETKDVIHMAALLILAAIAVLAIVATIVTAVRDGYCRVPFQASDARSAWPSSAQPAPTHLA
jgi:hypothetical protein